MGELMELAEVIKRENNLFNAKSDAIEIGLEIVAHEMGNVLQAISYNRTGIGHQYRLSKESFTDITHSAPDNDSSIYSSNTNTINSNYLEQSKNACLTQKSRVNKSPCTEPVSNIKARKKGGHDVRDGFLLNLSVINSTVIKLIKYRVERAMKEGKTFTVCGNLNSLRNDLVRRGWIEKIHITYNTPDKVKLQSLLEKSVAELVESASNPIPCYYKRIVLSKILDTHQVEFFWENNSEAANIINSSNKHTIVNRFNQGAFSYGSKQGLSEALNDSHWYHFPGLSRLRHPRTYNLADPTDSHNFLIDFKITAVISLLKLVAKVSGKGGTIVSPEGTIPLAAFDFAMAEASKCLRKFEHEDIDFEIEEAQDNQWNAFLEQFYNIVHIHHHFYANKKEVQAMEKKLIYQSKDVLAKLRVFRHSIDMDGCLNVWILKPLCGSQGIGIYLCRSLQYILKILKSNSKKRYIIQKYIEHPLLICQTKFDIRQWFLVHYGLTLTIWLYKECYIRFSSQPYNLTRLHESIHLTNNSIQSRYTNGVRDPNLPDHNMWDLHQFKKYLSTKAHRDIFEEVIYPGMKEAIVAAVLICRGKTMPRRNSFELCGSDFILSKRYEPWLLEINRRPALYKTTPVTARMCPMVLEDMVKVVVDKSMKHTGLFELVYQEKRLAIPESSSSQDLKLEGKPISLDHFHDEKNGSVHLTDSNKLTGYRQKVTKELHCRLHDILEKEPFSSSTESMFTALDSDESYFISDCNEAILSLKIPKNL